MYTRILVAIDGSESGDLALKEALSLAGVHRAMLRLVHVVDMVPPYFSGDTNFIDIVAVEEALAHSGRQILEKAHALVTTAGIPAETALLKTGEPTRRIADVVVAEAKRWPADLIVVGTHGRRGLSHLFLGSVAEGIVRTSTVPVLLIRGG